MILQTPIVNGNSGSITLNAKNSNINVGNLNANSLIGNGGEINLKAAGNINLNGSLDATNNINIKANNDINLLTQLTLPAGIGKLAFIADADHNGVGNFLMDTENTINTTGKNIEIQGANLTIGNIKTSSYFQGGNVKLNTNTNSISAGNITVNTIATDQTNGSNGGSVYIDARGNITTNYISSDASNGSNTKGGDITLLSGGNVLINGGYQRQNRAFGLLSGIDEGINSNAGNITVQAEGNISINPTNKILSYGAVNASVIRRYNDNTGNSGTIEFTSNNGNITVNQGIFTNSTAENGQSSGNSGSITLNATQGNVNVIAATGGAIVTRTRSLAETGNAGNIEINARNINIQGRNANSSDLDVTTQSSRTGTGGDIIFNSQNPISLTSLTIGTDGLNGAGGAVKIKAPGVNLDNTQLLTKTTGIGQAGNVEIVANMGSILFKNKSSIRASAESGATGNGGTINIIGKDFQLIEQSFLDASTSGQGNAGNINLNITDHVNIFGANSRLSTSTSSIGIGDNIEI